jgi:hypothetical protein
MAVQIDKVSAGTDSVTVDFSYVPGTGDPAAADSAFLYFGPNNSYDPTQPNDGYPSACRVSGSNPYVATFNPGVGAGQAFHFVGGVLIAGVAQDSGDQAATMSNGGTQDPSATASGLTATGVTLAWNSSDPGTGSVLYWKDGDSVQLIEAESVSTTTHSIALSELIGSTLYDYTFTTTFDNAALPPAVSAQASFTTPADSGPVDPPGRLGVSVSPQRVAVGQSAQVGVQLLKKDGSPVPGVTIHFVLGQAGKLQGTLAPAQAVTDAHGRCSASFTATAVPGRKAFRVIQVLAGTAPAVKIRRALVFGVCAGQDRDGR